ncbi:MAG: hypothetical protein ACHP78_01605 [Terriglobales bacterium]
MSEITRLPNTPVSNETGFLNHNWRSIRLFFDKRAFESKLERILRAAAGHEGNSLPAGDYEYELLSTEADKVVAEFADRWGLDVDLLRARIPGLAKLEGLAVPPPTKNYARLACLAMVAVPLVLFLMGAVVGLFNVGFHLVGGR